MPTDSHKPLSARHEAFVLAFVGDARFNATKAAIAAGYSERTARAQGSRLLTNVDILAAVQAWRDAALDSAITKREYRVERLDDLERRSWEVINERARLSGTRVPGGKTGLVTTQFKQVGTGEDAALVEEYHYDAGIVRSIQSLHEQAAKELGQWTERVDTSGSIVREFVLVKTTQASHTGEQDAAEGET